MTRISGNHAFKVARRLRSALLVTTAMTIGGAGQAYAQSVDTPAGTPQIVNIGGSANIAVDATSATGAPTAVQLQTNGGTIDVSVDTVTTTAAQGAGGAAVHLLTSGDKAITGAFDSITVSGDGDSGALIARTDSGAITLDIGSVESTGNVTLGVYAQSTNGNVAVTGDSVVLRGSGYDDTNGWTGDALVAISVNGTARATLSSGESNGYIGSVAVASGGAGATVTSGYAKTTGDRGTAVFSVAGVSGDARTTTGTVEASGASASAVAARANNGAAFIDAGTTTVTGGQINPTLGYSYAILGTGKTGVTINADTTTATGRGIAGVSATGDVVITTTGDTHSEHHTAVTISTTNNTTAARNATINLGAGTTTSSTATDYSTVYVANTTNDAIVNSAGTVTGAGPAAVINVSAGNHVTVNANVTTNAYTSGGAIFANGTNGTTVNAVDTTAAGAAITAVSATGDVVVATTGDTHSTASNAIAVSTAIVTGLTAPGGNVTISTAADSVTSSGATNTGTIGATARGNLTLAIAGAVTGSQTAAATIGGAANTGSVVANIYAVTNSGTREAVSLSGAAGVDATIGTAHANASTTNVVQAASQNGNVVFDLGSVTGSAANFMVNAVASSPAGSVTISADEVVNTNTTAPTPALASGGILGVARGGVTIVAGHVEAQGVAIRALTNTGGTTLGDGHISITTTGDITSRGSNAISVGGLAKSFDVTLAADHVVSGTVGTIVAGGTRSGTGGDATITNNGTVAARGAAETAIGATTFGNLTVHSNIVTVEGLAAPTSIFTPGGFSLVSTGGGNVSLDSISATVSGEGRYGAFLDTNGAGAITVDSGTVSNDADYIAAISANTESGAILITSGTATARGEGAHGIDATSVSGAITITAGTTTANGRGIDAYSDSGDVSITTTGNTSSLEDGPAIGADGHDVSILLGQGTITDGFEGGIEAEARGNLVIDARGTIRGQDDDAIGIAAEAAGTVSIRSNVIEITGTGEDPGTTAGFRSGQGGIAVEAGDGAVSIASNSVTVAGDNRYGIYVLGNGAIDVASAALRYDARDSAGIMILGGEGDVRVTSGALTATGASGAGIVARTTSGDITITADQTHAEGDGIFGNFTADAVVGMSQTGDVSITSNNASSAGKWGSAIAATGASVSVTSGTAAATGEGGTIVFARATGGDATVASANLQSSGAGTTAIFGIAETGALSITSDSIVSTGAGSIGINAIGNASTFVRTGNIATRHIAVVARADHGLTTLDVNGAVSSASSNGIVLNGAGTVTVAANASVTAAMYGVTSGAMLRLDNAGTISGEVGVNLSYPASVTNSGTIEGRTAAIVLGDPYATPVPTTLTNSGTIRSSDGNGLQINLAATNLVNSGRIDAGGLGIDVLGTLELDNSGTIVSAGTAVRSANAAKIVNSGSITSNGGTAVLALQGGVLENRGTIRASGVAIVAGGATVIDNAGRIESATGVAATLGGGDDRLILRTGSSIAGAVNGGAGVDSVSLIGSVAQPAASQSIGRLVNFETLAVDSGYWTASGAGSEFSQVTIANGATLAVDAVDGLSAIQADMVVNNGRLLVNASGATAVVLDDVAISGNGSLTLAGSGRMVLASPDLVYTGATNVEGGVLELTSGDLAGDLVISAGGTFRLGNGGASGTLGGAIVNNGAFIYDRSDSYTIAGDFSGSGALTKNGAGVLTFGGDYAFTGTTTINGGGLKFTGQLASDSEINLASGTLDLSQIEGGAQTIGELAGSASGTVELGSSALTVNQTSNTAFAGTISGDGGITKTGSGTLNLTGNSDYTGDTAVQGGTLKVNGSIGQSTVVMSGGATLGGNGTIGGLEGSGGNIAPGNSIGHLTVAGNIMWNPGFVYQVEVNNAGEADRIDATGTAQLGGATLQVLPEAGRYRGRTAYTILTAAGGVSGTFGTITSNFAFLTPSVTYGATTVTLALTRNDAAFDTFGVNAGQIGVANAIEALGPGNALFEETLLLQDSAVRPAFASVTGEIYGGIAGGTIENMAALRRSLTGRTAPEGTGFYAWGNSLGNWGDAGATSRSDHLYTSQAGLLGGFGYSTGKLDVALGFAGTKSTFRSQGEAHGKSRAIAGTLGYGAESGFWAKLGGSYAWNEFDVARRSALGALSQSLTGAFDGNSSQVFGEAGLMVRSGQVAFGPFVGLSQVSTRSDAVREAGGATGLAIDADSRDVTFGLAGLKVKGLPSSNVAGMSVNPNASVAWRHAWGDTDQVLGARFTGATSGFDILGPIVARDAAEVGLGVEARAGRFGFSIGYTGTFARQWSNHSGQASVSIRF
ncbi:autotransporter-associated beta strand protein [Sphingomonas naasensis]|uniref:Autotransporter domain-containing protein n=1 Tax=Sphingomonas naasensis TaxID=1344951 RepID=A0A4S1WQN5_9SPHN|nr:autotransporter-associated beta strand repeat-containing protein [Sphingomonas naasensis]NIJ20305.1 autotransporter-associated beta strand protein [Sphingomonas naasensis]TGX44427.1 hypothetical protein E5A74_06465 [Sphingomonas naasensis]